MTMQDDAQNAVAAAAGEQLQAPATPAGEGSVPDARPVPGRPGVEVQNVDKVYGNSTVALRGVDCTLREGEFVSLLGPSGCGKSTLLRIMAGLGGISGGSVRWWEQGFDVVGMEGHRLAFVFQDPTLMPWARVRANVRLPLDLMSGANPEDTERRIDEALEMVGLRDFGNAFPRELSGGMQMRASIARAMVTQPDFLLMDEPFGALDEMTRNRLNDDILQLWRDKRWTVAFVTHSVFEAVYLSTRIEVMAASPGRMASQVLVDEPYPRTSEFRKTHRFTEYCSQVSDALEEASAVGAQEATV